MVNHYYHGVNRVIIQHFPSMPWWSIAEKSHLFWNFLSWIHDRFMRVMHEILHAMSEGEKIRFYWGIHTATYMNGKVLKIIACLDSDVHDATNPVNEGTLMWVFNLFKFLYNKRCSHEYSLLKTCFHWEMLILKLYIIFCLFPHILFDDAFDDMTCLINTDSKLTLDNIIFYKL